MVDHFIWILDFKNKVFPHTTKQFVNPEGDIIVKKMLINSAEVCVC